MLLASSRVDAGNLVRIMRRMGMASAGEAAQEHVKCPEGARSVPVEAGERDVLFSATIQKTLSLVRTFF